MPRVLEREPEQISNDSKMFQRNHTNYSNYISVYADHAMDKQISSAY